MPAQAALEEEVAQDQAQGAESAEVAEPAAEPAVAEAGAAAVTADLLPEVGKPETKVVEQPTPSDKAYGTGEEVTPADRDALMRSVEHRMAHAIGPFTLACSNRRDEIHKAMKNHPEFLKTLGSLAFGGLVPGINGKNMNTGAGMPPSTSKLVSGAAGHSEKMKRVVEGVGKMPMMNFGLNFGELTASETSEEFVDQLGGHVSDANEQMRASLDGKSNEDLAALCAAFDPKSMTCSIYEEHIDRELSKLSVDGGAEKKPEAPDEMELKPTKEVAYVGDPGEGDKNQLAIVEKKDPKSNEKDEHKVVDMVPDEMKELAISKHGEEPGTLHQDQMHRR